MFILRKVYSFFVDTIQTLVLAAGIFLFIYAFLFRPFQVSGASMFPTYKDKQYILTNLISLKLGQPKQGDVIVFIAPIDKEKDFIKRVIGLPGNTIMIKNGFVYVNGKQLDESVYLHDVQTYGGAFLKEDIPFIVPQGYYFVMGDNRPYSSDSREWGPVMLSAIIGESQVVYWPPQDMKLIKNPYTASAQK